MRRTRRSLLLLLACSRYQPYALKLPTTSLARMRAPNELRTSLAALVACAAFTVLSPASCLAAPAAMKFAAEYSDLMHPLCERRITVEKAETKGRFIAHFSGTDVGPVGIGPIVEIACDDESKAKYKLRSWEFDGFIDGDKIDAGDEVHVGAWEESAGATGESAILWRGGNRWIVKK